MSNIEGFKANIEDYLHFSTEAGDKGTKIQDWQDYQRNVNATVKNIIDAYVLWQPNKDLATNNVVRSPNMVAGTYARVTKSGTTAEAEPAWTGVGTTVTDGTVTYVIYPQIIDFATQEEVTAGAIRNKMVSPAMLGQTLQVDLASEKRVNLNEADKSVTPGVTGILPVAHGGTGTDSLANVTVGKAGTLDGDAGLWDYLHRLGVNPTLPTTNASLNALGVFMSYFTQENKIANQPTKYGQLLNIPANKDSDESTQLWIEQPGGRMFHRGGNGSITINDTPFKRFLDTDDLSAAGVVAGDVSNANAWWVKLGGAVPLIIQGGYTWVGIRTDVKIAFPISFSHVLGIAGLAVVNYQNSSGRGLEHIKTFSGSSFIYYSGYDIDNKRLTWLAVGT